MLKTILKTKLGIALVAGSLFVGGIGGTAVSAAVDISSVIRNLANVVKGTAMEEFNERVVNRTPSVYYDNAKSLIDKELEEVNTLLDYEMARIKSALDTEDQNIYVAVNNQFTGISDELKPQLEANRSAAVEKYREKLQSEINAYIEAKQAEFGIGSTETTEGDTEPPTTP
ncbi:hypothetical protein [Paenibacillus turpanensis]|uniref:hypothetical protein n=1 Tax=Paenibacillus turpanensis TaxID=2689078 RepID=UPI0014092D53|nr:hypothetical protein [Paenibacillus turpanensis]